MPYKILKRGDEFCVVKKENEEVVKCHPTEKKAEDHMAALYANVEDAKEKTLKKVIQEAVFKNEQKRGRA